MATSSLTQNIFDIWEHVVKHKGNVSSTYRNIQSKRKEFKSNTHKHIV